MRLTQPCGQLVLSTPGFSANLGEIFGRTTSQTKIKPATLDRIPLLTPAEHSTIARRAERLMVDTTVAGLVVCRWNHELQCLDW